MLQPFPKVNGPSARMRRERWSIRISDIESRVNRSDSAPGLWRSLEGSIGVYTTALSYSQKLT